MLPFLLGLDQAYGDWQYVFFKLVARECQRDFDSWLARSLPCNCFREAIRRWPKRASAA